MKRILSFITTFIVIQLNAQTTIPGGYVHGNWTLVGSPYLIQGSVMVPNDSTLTIQAGVTVNFQGHYKLLVGGRLLAIGTATDSIHFTASNTTTGWYGIRFDTTHVTNDTSKFHYCHVEYGNANGTGVDAYGGAFMFNAFSKVIVSNCLVKNCIQGGGIYCTNNSSPLILNSTIVYCHGGGINLSGGSTNVSNNIISYNYGDGISGAGGSIYNNVISHNNGIGVDGTHFDISYNTITYNNGSNALGGGIGNGISGGPNAGTISHNIIAYNTCNSQGGGICCYGCGYIITDNFISNNNCPTGAGIALVAGGSFNPIISNNVIINNSATGGTGGGVYFQSGNTPVITNNTIVNNASGNGGGLYFSGSSSPSLNNNIIYGNTSTSNGNQVYINDEGSDPNFYYCDIKGGSVAFEMNGNFYSGTYSNNIDADPLFISPSVGSGSSYNGASANWTLQSTSPCINTGNPSGTYPATDLANNPRVYGSSIDMGAYEYQGLTGISKISGLTSQISIYPNPSSGNINITSNNNIDELKVTDVLGQLVYEEKLHTTNATLTLDNAGIYFVTTTCGKEISTKKVVVNK